jgi:hypothetical protein
MRFFRNTEPALIDRVTWHSPIRNNGAITDIIYHVYICSCKDFLPIGSGSSTRAQLIALGLVNVDIMLGHYWTWHTVRPSTARSILAFNGFEDTSFFINKLPVDESKALKDLIAFSISHKWFPGMTSDIADDLIAIEITREIEEQDDLDRTTKNFIEDIDTDDDTDDNETDDDLVEYDGGSGRALPRGGE